MRATRPSSAPDLEVLSDAVGRLCRCEPAVVQTQVVVGVDEVAAGAQLVAGIGVEQSLPARLDVLLAALVLHPQRRTLASESRGLVCVQLHEVQPAADRADRLRQPVDVVTIGRISKAQT